jgi:hypothetical protein
MHNTYTHGAGISGPKYKVERRAYHGVPQTVGYMVEFVQKGQTHPDVRNVAIATTKDIYPHDYSSELAALFYEACRRIRYVRDPANAEMLSEPNITLKVGAGDCDDSGVLLGSLVQAKTGRARTVTALGALSAAVGTPVQVVTAGFVKKGEHSHTFIRAWDSRSGRWVVLDPVAGPHTLEMISRVQGYKATDIPLRKS